MPSRVEIGKGILTQGHGYKDTINILDKKPCNTDCIYNKEEEYDCQQHNGDCTIIFLLGITKYTVDEVKKQALCIK